MTKSNFTRVVVLACALAVSWSGCAQLFEARVAQPSRNPSAHAQAVGQPIPVAWFSPSFQAVGQPIPAARFSPATDSKPTRIVSLLVPLAACAIALKRVAAILAVEEFAALEEAELGRHAEEAREADDVDASSTFETLARAITSRGGLVASISEGLDASGARGLRARADIPPGEPLLVLPPGTFLTTSENAFDARMLEWYEAVESRAHQLEPPLKPFELLLMMLVHAKAAGSQHDLAPYLDTLPSYVDLLRDWSYAELQLLQSDSLSEAASSQAAHCERTCNRLDGLVAEDYPDAAERREILKWADSIVRSRAVAVQA